MRKFRHIKKIGGNAAHNVSDFRIRKIGIAQRFKLSKRIHAHIRFNVYAHNMPARTHVIICRRIDEAQHNIKTCHFSDPADGKCRRLIHGGIGQMKHNTRQHNIAQGG